MEEPEVTAALMAALKRHVQVTLVLTTNPERESVLMQLQAAGARVVELGDSTGTIYIHAKVIVVDAGTPSARVFVGSQNFSIASLRYNRELGLITSAVPLVSAVAAVSSSDADESRAQALDRFLPSVWTVGGHRKPDSDAHVTAVASEAQGTGGRMVVVCWESARRQGGAAWQTAARSSGPRQPGTRRLAATASRPAATTATR